MKKRFILIVVFVVFTGLSAILVTGEKPRNINNLDLSVKAGDIQRAKVDGLKPDINFGKFPLYFIKNKGQVNKKAMFYAKASRYTLWLTKEGLVFDSTRFPGGGSRLAASRHTSQEGNIRGREIPETHVVERDVSRFMFIGANKNPEMLAIDEAKLKVNYFIGNDKTKWHGDTPTSQAVLYKELYKNIDLKIYGIEKEIEYDWIVKPGGNPADIKFVYKNIKGTRIDEEGNLLIETDFGELIHKKPVSFQAVNGNYKSQAPNDKKITSAKSHITNKRWSSESGVGARRAVPESNRRGSAHKLQWAIRVNATKRSVLPLSLCVRPLAFSPGTEHVDVRFKKIGKNTYGFSVGTYDRNRELTIDPVVLAYSTYLGGCYCDNSYDIAVDGSGYVYVTGCTPSTDFPTRGRYQAHQGERDVFVTKIDPTRSGAAGLIYSTYLGGGNSDVGWGIAVDGSGLVYVTGYTSSTDFPTLRQYQEFQRGYDVFLTKIDTNRSGAAGLLYSTYLGGEESDFGTGTAVDSSGYVYVTGYTESADFPTLDQYQSNQGDYDVFVTKIDPTQSGYASLIYSTYLGGGHFDHGDGIAVDGSGYVYVTGGTRSLDFPTRNRYQPNQGDYDVFVAKIDTARSGAAGLLYSTYLGGEMDDTGNDIAVDGSGYVYVTGYTESADFPTLSQCRAYQGYRDVFVTKIDTTGSGAGSLVYSTYLGGEMDDTGNDIAVDGRGNVYVTGDTESADFPTLDRYQSNQGGDDVFITKIDTARSGASGLIYSTYLGGGNNEYGYGIAVDGRGNVYVTGSTNSYDFPTLDRYQSDQGCVDAFITKLNPYPPLTVPTVTTGQVSSITSTSAVCGGKVTSDGGAEVLYRGVCFNKTSNPTTADMNTVDGTGTGSFTGYMTELTPNTTYYVAAYAKNTIGTSYGEVREFKTLNNPTISGTITSSGGTAVPGVILTFSNSGGKTTTNNDGYYIHTVENNWSGTVTPSKTGYAFNPARRTYNKLTSHRGGQDYTGYVITLSLDVSRETESAWIIKRDYGKIELKVDNPGGVVVAKYLIYRKAASGNFAVIAEIPGSQLQGSTYVYNDKYLDRDKSYTYKFTAVDAQGVILAASAEKTISARSGSGPAADGASRMVIEK